MRIPRDAYRRLQRAATKYAIDCMNNPGSVDLDALLKRQEAERENAKQGLQTCLWCHKGFTPAEDRCPHCGADVVPF